MAFKIKGADFFSDARNLVDVNLAGITTALNVGPTGAETFTVDGFTGIATAAGLKVGSSVVFNGETTDLGVEASTTQLVSAATIKSYVDAGLLDTGGTLTFGNGTETGTLDISDDTLTIAGTTNQIAASVDDSSNSVTFSLPNELQLPNTLAFGAGQPVSSIVTEAVGLTNSDNDTSIPTTAAVLDAISSGVSGGAPSIELNDSGDTAGKYYLPIAPAVGNGSQQALVTDDTLYYDPATGQLNAQEFNSLSDIRYKENIELIESPMAKVEALRGVTYDWKSSGNASAGIIAQEVQAVMPELISEQEDRLTVNYNGLTGLLIEAVKELSAEVAALKAAQ